MTREHDVLIVGGGIAGLAAAFHLRQHAPALNTILVERDARMGGKILTEQFGGFVIEGGPDSFLSSKPGGLDLCRELGIDDQLESPNEDHRRTYIMQDGRLHDLPEGLSGLVPSCLEPMLTSDLFSAQGKQRLIAEPGIPPRPADGDESLAAFVGRRFGEEVYERLVEPLLAGIYAGDGRELSLNATFPQLRRLELRHGSLIKGLQAAQAERNRSSESASRLPAFLTPRRGMGEIVAALLDRLPSNMIFTGTSIGQIRPDKDGYQVQAEDGRSLRASSLILATPAFEAARLLEGLDPDLANLLAGMQYVSTATISVAYPHAALPAPLDGFGYIVPRRERRPVLACTWTSSKFRHRTPEGYDLIRCFVGRAGQEEAVAGSDADLLALVRTELREVRGITDPPAVSRIFRWPRAMPQYVLGHPERMTASSDRLQAHPGIFLAGNAYRGVGIPDCVQSGRSAAAEIGQFLDASHRDMQASR